MKRITILSGAGMSAESGIRTFRDSGGLWEEHDIEDVATPQGWSRDPRLVLEFYNQRRRQLLGVAPNDAHHSLVRLESRYDTVIITQNIDDLHERAGSRSVLHLHGELRKARSSEDADLIYPCDGDIRIGDLCDRGSQLRPHVVWFGEEVPAMLPAMARMEQTDIVLIIGTSMQVYPAASLVQFAPRTAQVFYIDPNPNINYELARALHLEVVASTACAGVPPLVERLINAED